MKIIYGRSKPADTFGARWINARFFDGVIEGVEAVWLERDEPVIREAYEAAGVAVHAGLPDGPSADEGEVSPPPPKPKRTRKSKV
jgi:hypothetical protein